MRLRYLYLSLLFVALSLSGCREDDESISGGGNVTINGHVQKGPFINGTVITASELDQKLVATGKNFTTQVIGNKGSFSLRDVTLQSDYVQLIAEGFYFDEVRGEKSAAQLTLFALADVLEESSVNVNLLSHLEKERVIYLMQEEELSFATAKQQAQQEILAIFGIEKADMTTSELLDISQDGDDNAILLAISAILQGSHTVAELSELLADIVTDIREDGVLNSESTSEKIRTNAMSLTLADIRQHLEVRYEEMGVNAVIPNFEQYVDSDGDGFLNKDEDDTPDDFAFERQVDVAISDTIASNIITISGLKEGSTARASVVNGWLIINGSVASTSVNGADQRDTLSIAEVKNGDQVQVQLVTSSLFADTTTASLTVGSFTQRFQAVTDDYVPDDFTFTTQEDVATGKLYTSNIVTLTGLPNPTWAHIEGGILLKNNEEIEADSVVMVNGDQVAMRVQSSSEYATTTISSFTITGVKVSFAVTTDDYTPNKFQFTSIDNAVMDSLYTSETITLSGLPHPTPIHLDSGILLVNGQQANYETVRVMTGDQIAIQLSTKSDYETESIALLRIGAVEKIFCIKTPVDIWQKKSEYPGKVSYDQASFVINDKIYVGLGESLSNEFYEYDPTSDQWTKIADFPSVVQRPTGFSINGKGYIYANDDCVEDAIFAEYDPVSNSWTEKSNFPGTIDCNYISFSIGNHGYVGQESFWRYDPSKDEWTQVAAFPYNGRAVTFSTDSEGYVVLSSGSKAKEFWKYDATSNAWERLSDYPGLPVDYNVSTTHVVGAGFVVGEYAYVGSKSTGLFPNKGENNSFWKYDFKDDAWEEINIGSFNFSGTSSNSNSNRGYHLRQINYEIRMYEFTPPQD